MGKRQAKEITPAEARYLFLTHLAQMVNYWEKEDRAPTSKEKLEGLLFSFMTTFDGCSAGLPAYKIIPVSCQEDIDYSKEEGIDYYPLEGQDLIGNSSLHHEIYDYLSGREPKIETLYDFGAFLADQAKTYHKETECTNPKPCQSPSTDK